MSVCSKSFSAKRDGQKNIDLVELVDRLDSVELVEMVEPVELVELVVALLLPSILPVLLQWIRGDL